MIRVRGPIQWAFLSIVLIADVNRDARAADAYLAAVGGRGGSQFFAPCPAGQNLTGFELRAADDVDAIRALCVIAYSFGGVSAPQLTNGSGLIQHYSSASREVLGQPYSEAAGDWSELPKDWHGGVGGARASVICPTERPIVIGIFVAAEGANTVVVNNIHLYCGRAVPSQQIDPNPSAIFDAPGYRPTSPIFAFGGGSAPNLTSASQRCSDGQVAVGIHGRSGIWLDALGLMCDAPRIDPRSVVPIGRTRSSSPPVPALPICDAARDARARNSPNAPRLEALCQASKTPVVPVGRVGKTTTGPARPICDVARESRERNSPNAPRLEALCQAAGLQAAMPDLAARGDVITNQDPLAIELRNRQSPGAGQRGFDIGMAAAEGQTAPGPGKQRIHDSLPLAEQRGFEAAVAFSLERNRNADLAARGAAVALADTQVAQAHNVESDVFYWLGFDIATGHFGDPALGALGNTVAGAGAITIRNSLSAAGQRGFNASMAFHLNRVK